MSDLTTDRLPDHPEFDDYARSYNELTDRALAISGENRLFFAAARMRWLLGLLRERGIPTGSVLDYGCGTGGSIPFFYSILDATSVIGVDTSRESLRLAAARAHLQRTQLVLTKDYVPKGDVDLVFCNGVFHHIHPDERRGAVHRIHNSLRPGGLFAFWENNPLNPAVRYMMRRNPLDKNAIAIRPSEGRVLLRDGHFDLLLTHYVFFFPRWLAQLRCFEPCVCRVALGAQYLLLGRKCM